MFKMIFVRVPPIITNNYIVKISKNNNNNNNKGIQVGIALLLVRCRVGHYYGSINLNDTYMMCISLYTKNYSERRQSAAYITNYIIL